MRRIALIVTSMMLLLPAAASGAPGWLPESLNDELWDDPAQAVSRAAVAMAPDGTILTAWDSEVAAGRRAFGAVRPPGAAESTVAQIAGQTTTALGNPEIASGPGGHAIMWWKGQDGVMWTSYHAPGGGWSPAQAMHDPDGFIGVIDIAVDPAGRVVAVWTESGLGTDGRDGVRFARRGSGPGGTWQDPVTLTALDGDPPPGFSGVAVATAGAAGETTVVWSRYTNLNTGVATIETARGTAAGPAMEVETLVTATTGVGSNAFPVDVSTAPDGDTLIAYTQRIDGDESDILLAAGDALTGYAPVGGAVSPDGDFAITPELAVGTDGTRALCWRELSPDDNSAFCAVDPAGPGGFGAGTRVTPPAVPSHSAEEMPPVVDGDGVTSFAYLLREGNAPAPRKAQVVRHDPDAGTWSAPATIADSFNLDGVTLAGRPAGDLVAALHLRDTWQIELRGYDGAAPALSGLSIPATATTGQPVALGVTVGDAFPGTTTWTVGSATVPGTPGASHTFTSPGTYAVSVTHTDQAGTSTTLGPQNVVVSAPTTPGDTGGGGGGGGTPNPGATPPPGPALVVPTRQQPAPARVDPLRALTVARSLRLRSLLRTGVPVTVDVGAAGSTVEIAIVAGRTVVGRLRRTRVPAGRARLTVPIAKRHAGRVRRRAGTTLQVRVTVTPPGGPLEAQRRTIAVRPG